MTHIFRSSQWLNKAGIGLGLLTLGTGALLLPGCNSPTEIGEDRTNVTTEDYPQTSQVSESIGEEATIRSTIQEPLDGNGVLLNSEDGASSVLVVNIAPPNITLPSNDTPIQVTGRVVEFNMADIETEYGLDLDEGLYADYEQQPAIIADAWALAPTPEMLAENPEAYYGQKIAVEGDARVLSPNALAVYEDGWIDDVGILVVGVNKSLESSDTSVQDGESITVTGTPEVFDINTLKGEYDLGLNEQEVQEFANRYTERPVIMADDVYASAVDE